ncbi:hypothetical protein ACFOWM_11665 [Ferruginibacter yonginensis]|uniref:J domain-containing protein n=1 Tax=Ferruginibacter yonginensis TaxID=1310416 RepID=A0ABV8QUZ3_9BACT
MNNNNTPLNTEVNQPNNLPIIVITQTHNKKDTLLEKEIKKFNHYIESIYEYEQEAKRIAFEKAQLDTLVRQKIVPQLVAIAQSKVKLVQHAQNIITQQRKIPKAIHENFIVFAIAMLSDTVNYSEAARNLYNEFVTQQAQLLSTKQQKVKEKNKQKQQHNSTQYANNENETVENETIHDNTAYYDIIKETTAAPNTTIKDLYKTLAKMLHPDMEQDVAKKKQKEALMQQLTAARDAEDLLAMLQLQQQANVLNAVVDTQSFFSIDKLKAFNKVLRHKLLQLKNDVDEHIFGQAWRKATHTSKRKKVTTPHDNVNKELKDLKRIKKSLEDDIKNIHDIDDVEFMLMGFISDF